MASKEIRYFAQSLAYTQPTEIRHFSGAYFAGFKERWRHERYRASSPKLICRYYPILRFDPVVRTMLQYLVFAGDNWPREPRCAYGHINIVSHKIAIRGVQVMLDSDIASLFQVGVKPMNQQRKRNPDRFPEDFCFQLTKEERDCLRSQIVTFTERTRDRKYLPYVFTEQGIIALAGVLRSGLADKMAVDISRVFVSMRRFILENGDVIQRLAELQSRQIAFENETVRKLDTLFYRLARNLGLRDCFL